VRVCGGRAGTERERVRGSRTGGVPRHDAVWYAFHGLGQILPYLLDRHAPGGDGASGARERRAEGRRRRRQKEREIELFVATRGQAPATRWRRVPGQARVVGGSPLLVVKPDHKLFGE
jgi:hypothetical protein